MSPLIYVIVTIGALTPVAAFGQGGEQALLHPSLDAAKLSGFWGIPFVGVLLSIAFLPLLTPTFWHRHRTPVALLWVLGIIFPLLVTQGWEIAAPSILATCTLEYLPFIILILTLFTLSSGITLRIPGSATPPKNTLLLLIAMLTANLVGTTGAAMLFIRPLLQLNATRAAKTHLVIFFIILVGNLGGCLSALGDPPLFLGFLKGVPFFWPTFHLLAPFVLVAGPVLLLFCAVDAFFYFKEGLHKPIHAETPPAAWSLQGALNLFLLSLAVALILLSGMGKLQGSYTVFHFSIPLVNLVRDGSLLAITWASWRFTPRSIREANLFSWEPIKEVGVLFFAIFITAMPVVALLQAGSEGALAPLFDLVQYQGQPVNSMYFWLSGMLSAFLDNAPTYLVFFSLAGGDPVLLTGPLANTLIAISAGSVFMGALTYIGNAPNFMVKAIAETHHILMPSFFGYFALASLILLPLFLMLTWIIFL